MNVDDIIDAAHHAGMSAFHSAKPTPMAVQSSGLFESFDPSKPYEVVDDGVCGFAWITIAKRQMKFVNQLKKSGIGDRDVYGTYTIRPMGGASHSQSMERKKAYCQAFANVLREHDIKCGVCSRLD